MELSELIKKCWAEHDSDPQGTAVLLRDNTGLVTDAKGAAQYAGIFLHTVGEEIGDWAGAADHLEGLLADLPEAPELALALVQVAVARTMADDTAGAQSAVERATALAPEPKEAVPVRVQLLVAEARCGAGDWQRALELHAEGLATVRGGVTTPGLLRTLAVCSNNIASTLLDLAERDEALTRAMVSVAEAARETWLEAGGWLEDERADYLLALVRTVAGNPTVGLEHAQRALDTIASHAADGGAPVDEAFLHLARARALKALGRSDEHAAALDRARELAAGFEGGLREWFDGELAKAL
jgi:tetratricopeptide (TPR) repeat protein